MVLRRSSTFTNLITKPRSMASASSSRADAVNDEALDERSLNKQMNLALVMVSIVTELGHGAVRVGEAGSGKFSK
jgi:hypothetical protein